MTAQAHVGYPIIRLKRLGWGLVLALAALCACIPVDDLGPMWDKGVRDPQVEGHWRRVDEFSLGEDYYVSVLSSGDHYELQTHTSAPKVLGGEPPRIHQQETRKDRGKSLVAGKHRFLMVIEAKGESGLQRYSVEGDTLTKHFLHDEVLIEAIRSGRVKGTLPPSTPEEVAKLKKELAERPREAPNPWVPRIGRLDAETLHFLQTLADEPANWRTERYQRVTDLQAALKASRTYPATADTERNTHVAIDVPDLEYFAHGRTRLLLRHLESSPEWRVFYDGYDGGCGLVAHRRTVPTDWTPADLREGSDPLGQDLASFRFHDQENCSTSGYQQLVRTEARPVEGEVQLKLRSSDQGIESFLVVGQAGLWFEFAETSRQEPRIETRKAMTWLREFLRTLRDSERELERAGYASALMKPGSIRHGAPTLHVRDGWQPGIFNVEAWVNPGRPGLAYMKAFDARTGQRLSERRLFRPTNERTGWSKDPRQLFVYNCLDMKIDEGDWDHTYDARFELWFRPDDGAAERKLVSLTRAISGWQQ